MTLTKVDDRGLKTPIDLLDNERIRLGTGNDLSLYHNGTDSYINNDTGNLNIYGDVIQLRSSNDEYYLKGIANGAVELYYDNSKKFDTVSGGTRIFGYLSMQGSGGHVYLPDSAELKIGNSEDLRIYHNGTDSYLDNSTGALYIRGGTNSIQLRPKNDEWAVIANANAGVEVAYDGVKKFETTSAGAHCHGNLDFFDNHHVRLGTGTDLKLYHNGTNSYIENNTGALVVSTATFALKNAADNENIISAFENGQVELYHNNSKKFETTSTGAKIISSGSSHGLRVHHSNGNEVAALTHGGSGDEGVLILKDSGANTVAIRGEVGQDSDITTGGNFDLEHDSAKLRFGAGNDLQIYHNGSESHLKNSTGALVYASLDHKFSNAANNSEYARIDANGIKFNGETAAAHALSDYEEGYWSPVAVDGQSLTVTAGTSSHASRRYVKIGRQVTAWFSITWSGSNSSANFRTRFSGLPFSPQSNANGTAAVTFGYYTGSETDMLIGFIDQNTGLVEFYENGDAMYSYSESAGDRIDGFITYVAAS